MHRFSKKFVGSVIAVAVLSITGVAVSLWTANGSGSGQARAITAQTITVTAATGAADLYPGFSGGDVYFTLTNSNPYPVTFTAMTPGTITSGNATACPAANVTVASATGLSLLVPANSTTSTVSIADVTTMLSTAPNGCQGVAFTVTLTLSGSQS